METRPEELREVTDTNPHNEVNPAPRPTLLKAFESAISLADEPVGSVENLDTGETYDIEPLQREVYERIKDPIKAVDYLKYAAAQGPEFFAIAAVDVVRANGGTVKP